MDRKYFHSILLPRARQYPLRDRHRSAGIRGGRTPEKLGTHLVLPAWLDGTAAAGSGTTAAHLAHVLAEARNERRNDPLARARRIGRGYPRLARRVRISRCHYFAPEATGRAWYPYSFLAPIEQNEPWLSKSLAKVGETVDAAMRQGIAREKIVIAGFSQGAAWRRNSSPAIPRATVGWSRSPRPDRSAGKRLPLPRQSRRHARVLRRGRSRCSRAWKRVEDSARMLASMGADVTLRRYLACLIPSPGRRSTKRRQSSRRHWGGTCKHRPVEEHRRLSFIAFGGPQARPAVARLSKLKKLTPHQKGRHFVG